LARPHVGSLLVCWDVAKLAGRIRLGSLPMWLLAHLLNRFIRNGVLRLIAADGSLHIFGGHGLGPTVTIRLHDPRLHIKLFLNPKLHAGEAYMNGPLTFE
jgi:cyclopropane-fatty-acyl-phospholipid synthase